MLLYHYMIKNTSILHNVIKNTKTFIIKYNISISILIVGIILILVNYQLINKSNNKNITPYNPSEEFNKDLISQKTKLFGRDNAKIIMIKYTDPECPYCKLLHENVIVNKNASNSIEQDYKDIAVYYSFMAWPYHPNAPIEISSMYCVNKHNKNKYLDYVNAVFHKTQGNNFLQYEDMLSIATELGIEREVIDDCVKNDTEIADQVKRDGDDADNKEINGTPTTYILIKNGDDYVVYNKISGARDYKYFKKVLDKAISTYK